MGRLGRCRPLVLTLGGLREGKVSILGIVDCAFDAIRITIVERVGVDSLSAASDGCGGPTVHREADSESETKSNFGLERLMSSAHLLPMLGTFLGS